MYKKVAMINKNKLLSQAETSLSQHGSFPYVWGGTCPDTLEDRPNDLFNNTPRELLQVAGAITSGQPNRAGFDCSGWVRYLLCLAGDTHPDLTQDSSPSCAKIYNSFKSRKDLYHVFEGPRSLLDLSDLEGGDLLFFGRQASSSYKWTHIGLVSRTSGDMLHCSRYKPGSGDLTITEGDQEKVYHDMTGGINQMSIAAYQSPEWEQDNDIITVFRYLDHDDQTTLSVRVESHQLKHPFQTAHETKTRIHTLYTSINHPHTKSGQGEATLYYGETMEQALQDVSLVRPKISSALTTHALQSLLPPGATRNALDCALHDYEAKRTNTSLATLHDLPVKTRYQTCMTIGIDTDDKIRKKVREVVADYPILKIKCDGANEEDDLRRLEIIRHEAPEAEIWIDANEGWQSLAHYRQLIPQLKDLGITMIEQPFHHNNDHWIGELTPEERPIPLCADESCQTSADVPRLKELGYDIINIKLAKTGGFTEALKVLNAAKAHGLDIMLGNQNGTTLGMEPLLALAGDECVKYLDLDGPLLLIQEDGMRADRSISYNHSYISWVV